MDNKNLILIGLFFGTILMCIVLESTHSERDSSYDAGSDASFERLNNQIVDCKAQQKECFKDKGHSEPECVKFWKHDVSTDASIDASNKLLSEQFNKCLSIVTTYCNLQHSECEYKALNNVHD